MRCFFNGPQCRNIDELFCLNAIKPDFFYDIFSEDDNYSFEHKFSGRNSFLSKHDGLQQYTIVKASIDSLCPLLNSKTSWPEDSNECEIKFWIDHHVTVPIKALPNAISISPEYMNIGWNLLKVEEFNLDTEIPFKSLHLDKMPKNELVIKLHLKRNSLSLKTLFVSPYFCKSI